MTAMIATTLTRRHIPSTKSYVIRARARTALARAARENARSSRTLSPTPGGTGMEEPPTFDPAITCRIRSRLAGLPAIRGFGARINMSQPIKLIRGDLPWPCPGIL